MYLDPGFGGMLIQVIIALVVAGGALWFILQRNAKKLVSRAKSANNDGRDYAPLGETDRDIVDMLDDDEKKDE